LTNGLAEVRHRPHRRSNRPRRSRGIAGLGEESLRPGGVIRYAIAVELQHHEGRDDPGGLRGSTTWRKERGPPRHLALWAAALAGADADIAGDRDAGRGLARSSWWKPSAIEEPRGRRHLAEFPPQLAPGIATVVAAIEVAVPAGAETSCRAPTRRCSRSRWRSWAAPGTSESPSDARVTERTIVPMRPGWNRPASGTPSVDRRAGRRCPEGSARGKTSLAARLAKSARRRLLRQMSSFTTVNTVFGRALDDQHVVHVLVRDLTVHLAPGFAAVRCCIGPRPPRVRPTRSVVGGIRPRSPWAAGRRRSGNRRQSPRAVASSSSPNRWSGRCRCAGRAGAGEHDGRIDRVDGHAPDHGCLHRVLEQAPFGAPSSLR